MELKYIYLKVTGFFMIFGSSNLRWHTSFGISLQTCWGTRWGTRLVTSRHWVEGCKSHTSSGFTTVELIVLSWHSFSPGTISQKSGAQIFLGTFSHHVEGLRSASGSSLKIEIKLNFVPKYIHHLKTDAVQ